jgi:transposase
LQGKKDTTNKLFYSVTLEQLVPNDHPVRRIKAALDLNYLYKETRQYYSHEGKPSIDPVVLFKLHLLGYFFGISSERQLFREVQVNLAYRWYLGYDLDEEIAHHSIMTKSRYRFPVEVFERLFKRIVRQCRSRGLISGDYYFMDSSLVRADVSKSSFEVRLRTEEEYLKQIGSGSVEKRRDFDGKVDPPKMGRRQKTGTKSDWYFSRTDVDAQKARRPGIGGIPAYKAHLCVDRKKRVILSIDGSKANDDDMTKIHSLYTNALFAVSKKPCTVVADSHYGGVEALKYFQDQRIQTCIPPRITNTRGDKYKNTDFKVIGEYEGLECPAGHQTKRKNTSGYRYVFQWPKRVCDCCLLKSKCSDTKHGRIVSYFKGECFERAKALVDSVAGKKLARARQTIVEGVIGEAKGSHLMGRCKYRGLSKFRIQMFLTASAINLKRLLRVRREYVQSGRAVAITPSVLKLAMTHLFSQLSLKAV